jgi:hypothetical protein
MVRLIFNESLTNGRGVVLIKIIAPLLTLYQIPIFIVCNRFTTIEILSVYHHRRQKSGPISNILCPTHFL